MNRLKTVAAMTGVAAAALGALVAPTAAFADIRPMGIYCDPYTQRQYTQTAFAWYGFDSGTINNTSSGSVTKSFTHSKALSLGTTVSAEVGVKADVVVAEINEKVGVSVSVNAAYTTSTTFSVTAPAHTKISYKDGIAKRTYHVTVIQTYTNCDQRRTSGTVVAADNYSEVKNA